MIAQTIQLALAPVFVLVAIGNFLNILSSRLGRIVDRSRKLQQLHEETVGRKHDMVVWEIRLVDRRMSFITHAIRLLVISGLAIGATVGILFLDSLLPTDLEVAVIATFVASVALLMISLVLFLRETLVAAKALRIPRDYLELHRDI